MNTISRQIKKYRTEKGITQEQLGTLVGVSMQAVSKWERGGTPDIELLPVLADVLEVSIDELFGCKQKSLKKTITETIYPMDKSRAYNYAFELCWSIFSDLAHFNGKVRGSSSDSTDETDPELCYFSKLITDAGLACVRLSENFKTFFLMPEPKGSLQDKLADIEKLQKLFETFSDIDLLKVLFDLYTRPNNAIDATFISRETGIAVKRVEQIMDTLAENNLVYKTFGTTADGDIVFYMYIQESSVIPLLCFADEIQTKDMRDYVVEFKRSKPLF